jgi:hypothetical protein
MRQRAGFVAGQISSAGHWDFRSLEQQSVCSRILFFWCWRGVLTTCNARFTAFTATGLWALFHDGFVIQPWHVTVVAEICCAIYLLLNIYGKRIIPFIDSISCMSYLSVCGFYAARDIDFLFLIVSISLLGFDSVCCYIGHGHFYRHTSCRCQICLCHSDKRNR